MFNVKTIGGVRNDPLPDHPSGHALDFMISSTAQGDAIAQFVTQHHAELGVKYVIWNRRYWDPQQGWGPYTSPPQLAYNPHTDHVHVTFLDQPGPWTSGSGYSLTSTGTPDAGSDPTCAWHTSFPLASGDVCWLTKKQVRQLVGGNLMVAGAIIGLVGVVLLMVYGLKQTGAARILPAPIRRRV
jgi:hypothetical protein